MLVHTNVGDILGYQSQELYLFKGIPYGKAKRFMAPEKVSWDDVFEATNFSKKAPQIKKESIHVENISEDCLTLNIYTPSLNASLPVLVEVHGGAFQTGSNQGMDPFHVIQNDSFVYVTINYRLGVLGYLYLDDYPTSGNNGTLDQLLALEWVKENIAAFGGDPSKITILGSSAGAKAIGALMANEKANDLFSQAILISGAYQSVRSIQTAKVVSERYLDLLSIKDASLLETLPLETLLEAQQKLCVGSSTCLFGPVADGKVIPVDFYERFHQGKYWKGNLLLGSSLHELVFYDWMDQNFTTHAPQICEELFGKKADLAIQEANLLSSNMPLSQAYVKVLSDGMYRTYTYKMAKTMANHGSNVYLYGLHLNPACHVLDHLIALNPKEKYQAFFKEQEKIEKAIQLGQTIRQHYIDFIINGKVGWEDLRSSQQLMIFDEESDLKPFDLKDVCDCFEDEVFIL